MRQWLLPESLHLDALLVDTSSASAGKSGVTTTSKNNAPSQRGRRAVRR